jgi:hypothetical protein
MAFDLSKMKDPHLYLMGDTVYAIDMGALRMNMLDMQLMGMPEPPMHEWRPNVPYMDFAPVIDSRQVVLSSFDLDPSPWKFYYLFPLGKRAYVKKGE